MSTRLADCFIDALSYTKLFLRRPGGDYAAFRQRVEQRLADARERAQAGAIAEDAYQSALFAVVAWLDEAVMCSGWADAERWRRNLLQKVHFNTTRAGVDFFTRLEALPPGRKDVREVYYFCLMLGFKGQYVYGADQRALEALKRRNLEYLVDDAKKIALEEVPTLFPGAYPIEPPATPPRRRRLRPSPLQLTLLLGPLLVLALLYLTYDYVLGTVVSNFVLLSK